jgi:hypothetical protein
MFLFFISLNAYLSLSYLSLSHCSGFVKPRVLILLPTRHHCFQAIAQIVKLMPLVKGKKLVVNNKKKCFAEFFTPTEIDASTRKPGS